MNFEIEIISTEEYTRTYNRTPKNITKRASTYVRLTEQQKAQKREDRLYHRNWKSSI